MPTENERVKFGSGGPNWAIPQKIQREKGGLTTYFLENQFGIFKFFILPLEIPVKKLHP